MTFEQLLYVEVLSHHKSLQKAADVLHISKPGLSLAISELEKELGVKLFDRTSSGTEITPIGLQLLSSVSDILKSKSNLEQLVAFSVNEGRKEVVHIRYINTMFRDFLLPFLDHYEEKYQNVYYDISRDSTPAIIEQVKNGEIDAGFIANSDIESEWIRDLVFQPVCYGKIVLGVAADSPLLGHPISLDELKEQKFCLFDDAFHEALFDRLQYLCGPLEIVLKTDDYWAISQAVNRLGAVSIARDLQGRFSREELETGLVPLSVGHLFNDSLTLGWLTNPRVPPSGAAMELMQDISDALKSAE